jgi:amino acid adenylation domain-containing protein
MDLKNIEDIFPLLPAQEAARARQLRDARAGVGRLLCTLRGPLDAALFAEAWRRVAAARPALRAFFVWERLEKPLRLIRKGVALALEQHDWRGLAPAEQEERHAALLCDDGARGFNPSEAPLARLTLCRTSDDEYRFALTHHRLLLDRRSLLLVFREVLNVYAALRVGAAPPAPAHAPTDKEFAGWLKRQDRPAAESYWREALGGGSDAPGGADSTTPLTVGAGVPLRANDVDDSCRPGVEDSRCSGVDDARRSGFRAPCEQQLVLPEAAARALASVAESRGLELSTVFAGAWACLLQRYGGDGHVTFGVTLDGLPRELLGAERMIGAFANTLPLGIRLDPEAPFADTLRELKTREDALRRFAPHGYAPASADGNLPRHTSFETTLLFEGDFDADADRATDFGADGDFRLTVDFGPTGREFAIDGLGFAIDGLRLSGYDDAPLNVALHLRPQLTLRASYDGARFDDETVARMLGHLATLLEAVTRDPERRPRDFEFLTEEERSQLLVAFNDTAADYPRDKTVHRLFEEQAALTPDSTALVFGEESLTYAELNARANKLAHHLLSLGVGPDMLVGLCVERSAEMVVGLLGILKAGGAYLPLDPAYPPGRLAFMLEDAQMPVLVTQSHLADELPSGWAQVVCLDEEEEGIAARSDENPVGVAVTPSHLAYVMYTSGSTGTPKGVCVPHRAVARLVKGSSFASFSAEEVFLHLAPPSFDASTFELWGALLNGARLVLMPAGQSSLEEIGAAINRHSVTTLWLTAGLFHLMASERPADLRGLRQLLAGGDVLSPSHVNRMLGEMGEGSFLVNGYGPTENTTFTCCHRMAAGDEGERVDGAVPVGRPIANTRVYVLGERLEPVPIGVAGELYTSGDGLARGYLNRPALTAERFIPDPFSAEPGGRMYRTGDVARWRRDGAVEFVGRRDGQVKVRGFRVEVGEIEAALAGHAGVRAAVVVARGAEGGGDKRLVAYVTAAGGELGAGELREYLKGRLPEYMMPSAFVVLEELPLNANGKVDRRALPEPEEARSQVEQAYAAPSTEGERVLAEIWEEVLGLRQVGVEDNFFELGGDSMRSIQVRAKAQNRGLDFSVQEMFEHQTVRELAALARPIGEDQAATQRVEPFALVSEEDKRRMPAGVEDAYPLSALQAGMVFHSDYGAGSAVYHDIFSIHMKVACDLGALRESIAEVVARHPVLRTSFDVSGFAEPLQLVHASVETPFAVTDLRHLDADARERAVADWFEAERTSPFEWGRAPLMRIHVHLRGEDSLQFNLSFHHAILDGWSMASMLTELFRGYLARLGGAGGDAALPPPPSVSFGDFVALERRAIESEESREFWQRSLSGAPAARLPRWPSGDVDAPRGARGERAFNVEPEVVEGLQRFAQRLGVPLKSVLLAAHMRVLALLCGGADVTTGVVFNGRPEEDDGERVLGLFLNTLPLRARLGGGTFEELVRAVFETERGLLAHRRFPLAELQRMAGRAGLFETLFNYTHFHVYDNVPRLEGVEILDSRSSTETNFTFEANFNLEALGSRLTLLLWFDPAEFREEQVEAAGNYYLRALAAMAADPAARYDAHTPLPEEERRRLLADFNDTAADYPRDLCVHQLFEAQAALTPDSTALVFGEESSTYGELNRRANKLAHHLRALGVGPEVLVGLCVERSVEMVVGLLAILKAGGAYVPLDPALPRERLAFVLADTNAAVLITDSAADSAAYSETGGWGGKVVALDAARERLAAEGDENLHAAVTPDSSDARPDKLAYVIYTSGSTGVPKGVAVTHLSVCNHLAWMRRTFPLTARDRVLQLTPFTFDVSVWEFFGTLSEGAALVLLGEGEHRDARRVSQVSAARGVTVLQTVPGMLRALSEGGGLRDCVALRRVHCGGEALGARLAAEFLAQSRAELYNMYGPTETTIDAAYLKCEPGNVAATATGAVPIGRPMANARLYVLDAYLQPAPTGSNGELYIGGEGLARGYLNRAALTAEKFIPDPFSAQPGARLYRTGDVARWLPDGTVEFVGRVDGQVKVRGFRVEPGEIEAALEAHAAVREAVVTAQEGAGGEKYLVAHVVPAEGVDEVSVELREYLTVELREYLKARLPEYMVPSAFVMLEELPLLPSGKVDRRALRAHAARARVASRAEYVAPRTPTEELLADIWAGVLGAERFGVHDDFFESGGHSLAAVLVVARVRAALNVEIPLRAFVDEARTIERLAALVELAQIAQAGEQELASMLEELESLSEDEVKALLANSGAHAADAERA